MTAYIKLKEIRMQKKLTQRELSESANIERSVISYIEGKPNANIRIHTICKLSNALSCNLDELIKCKE
jgi:DNA-binding Xre family transcriptional regulator